MTTSPIGIPEEVLDEFLAGRCMDLAAAIHRKRGWEIRAELYPGHILGTDTSITVDELIARLGSNMVDWPYISHAFCVNPETGNCHDIAGGVPAAEFGWSSHITGMDEEALRRLVDISAQRKVPFEKWNAGVVDAAAYVEQYQCDVVLLAPL
jgi:hypothetical protein